MPFCPTNCGLTGLPPLALNPCRPLPRPGGIHRLVFATCAAVPADLQNTAQWLSGIQACQIRISGDLLGEKPAPTVARKRISSCLPELVVAKTHTIKFTDYQHDPDTQTDHTFWCTVEQQAVGLRVGFFGCDGYFYGFYPFALELADIKQDTAQGTSHLEGTLTIESLCALMPHRLPPDVFEALVGHQNHTCPPTPAE
jgi:hypothetical protein